MMRRIGVLAAALVAVFAAGRAVGDDGGAGGGTLALQSFNTRLAMGFNYDLLRPMTGVSFLYPVGYLGFNVPIGYSAGLNDFMGDEAMNDLLGYFKPGEKFNPTAGAEQNANYSVRVDVPMLSGVGTFAYTQNFFMNFSTSLGGSSAIDTTVWMPPAANDEISLDGFLKVKGALRLPLSFGMSWETMTFGYAYRVGNSDDLIFALNMHRHMFSADIRMKADIDLLGYANVTADSAGRRIVGINEELINFSSDRCKGFAQGRFRAEAWAPAVGVKWKRFSLNSRFGIDTKAKGSASGGFVVPHLVDLETGDMLLISKADSAAKKIGENPSDALSVLGDSDGLIPKGIDSITYTIDESFQWKMPQGHTLAFEIIPQRLSVSYTKLFGEVAMKMNVLRKTIPTDSLGNPDTAAAGPKWYKSEDLDIGIAVDHIVMLSVAYPSFFANVGVAGFDIRSKDKRVLGDNESLKSLRVGDVVMILPVLNGGFNIGTKLQLHLEADILPLPAVRSGVNYFF